MVVLICCSCIGSLRTGKLIACGRLIFDTSSVVTGFVFMFALGRCCCVITIIGESKIHSVWLRNYAFSGLEVQEI